MDIEEEERLFIITFTRFIDSWRFKKRKTEIDLLNESKDLFPKYMKSDFYGLGWVAGSMASFLKNHYWEQLK